MLNHSIRIGSPLLCLVAAGVFALPISASAGPIHLELGDAGATPGTAQLADGDAPAGSPVTNITGEILGFGDGDVYRIFVGNPAGFSATTQGQPGTLSDTQLHVFTNTGVGIIGNDDNGISLRSTIPVGSLASFPAGYYLLGISAYDNDPIDAGGFEIFTDNFPGLQTPIGGVGPLAGYNGSGFGLGTYDIALTGVIHTNPVPEPSSLLLFGSCVLSLVGYGGWQRKRGSTAAAQCV